MFISCINNNKQNIESFETTKVNFSDKQQSPYFKIDFIEGNDNLLDIKIDSIVYRDSIKNPSITSVYSKPVNDSIFKLSFNYGIGNSVEFVTYQLNTKSKEITKRTSFTANSSNVSISNEIISYPINQNFSSDFLYDLPYDEARSIHFSFETNSDKENGIANLTLYYQLIKNLHDTKSIQKLKLASDVDVLDIINQYCPISYTNYLTTFNDIGYYLEQSGLYEEAIYLLEKIINQHPDRTVAYINLGDAYWGLGDKDKAQQAYKTYVKQMKANAKGTKIPKQVLERINE